MTEAMTMIDNTQVKTMPQRTLNQAKIHSDMTSDQAPLSVQRVSSKAYQQSGFTLIEIMVVIVILAILAGPGCA